MSNVQSITKNDYIVTMVSEGVVVSSGMCLYDTQCNITPMSIEVCQHGDRVDIDVLEGPFNVGKRAVVMANEVKRLVKRYMQELNAKSKIPMVRTTLYTIHLIVDETDNMSVLFMNNCPDTKIYTLTGWNVEGSGVIEAVEKTLYERNLPSNDDSNHDKKVLAGAINEAYIEHYPTAAVVAELARTPKGAMLLGLDGVGVSVVLSDVQIQMLESVADTLLSESELCLLRINMSLKAVENWIEGDITAIHIKLIKPKFTDRHLLTPYVHLDPKISDYVTSTVRVQKRLNGDPCVLDMSNFTIRAMTTRNNDIVEGMCMMLTYIDDGKYQVSVNKTARKLTAEGMSLKGLDPKTVLSVV